MALNVNKIGFGTEFEVDVPSSKSLLSRALFLSAFTKGEVHLLANGYGEDGEAMLVCLNALGIEITPLRDGFWVKGGTPKRTASLDFRSAGTAARFLMTALAFFGGDYEFKCSRQLETRPMPTDLLESLGVTFEYVESGFPRRMHSGGIRAEEICVETEKSTQFASALMLTGAVFRPLALHFPAAGRDSYLKMTASCINSFGGECLLSEKDCRIRPIQTPPKVFTVEPDVSSACYFYALSLLLRARVLVRGVRFESLQGDLAFLRLLSSRGVKVTDTQSGIVADGRSVSEFEGFDEDLANYSDQTLTLAALAPFATTPSRLRGIGHIRRQECDRIAAIEENLTALGVPCRAEAEEIEIFPAPVHPATIQTFGDHRVAMAFALVGTRCGNVEIDDPACVRKTFPNYFETLRRIAK